jgi:hypothetical protein
MASGRAARKKVIRIPADPYERSAGTAEGEDKE